MIVRMEIESDGVITRVEREYEVEVDVTKQQTPYGKTTVRAIAEDPILASVTKAVAAGATFAHQITN